MIVLEVLGAVGLLAGLVVAAGFYLWLMFSEFALPVFLVTLGLSSVESLDGGMTHAGAVVLFWVGAYALVGLGCVVVSLVEKRRLVD